MIRAVLNGLMNLTLIVRVVVVSFGFGLASGFAAASADTGKPDTAQGKVDASTSKDVSSDAAAETTDGKKLAQPAQKKGRRPLEKGMNEATIIEIIGKPTEVKHMESPEGKAEMWIYRKEAGQRAVQVVVGEREVPAFTGVGSGNHGVATTKELIYGTKHVKLYRVTSLLMFNGELTVARQTTEQSETY